MKIVVFGLIVLLAVVHQSFWLVDGSDMLLLGFLPVSLAYHAGISMAAAFLWAMAVKFCWPAFVDDVEAMDEGKADSGGHS